MPQAWYVLFLLLLVLVDALAEHGRHSGTGLRAQTLPDGCVPSLTFVMGISMRVPLAKRIHCESPANDRTFCWKQASVTPPLVGLVEALNGHSR